MNKEELKQHYLAKAKEAEVLADNAPDQRFRERWLGIAAGYRSLAGVESGITPVKTQDQTRASKKRGEPDVN